MRPRQWLYSPINRVRTGWSSITTASTKSGNSCCGLWSTNCSSSTTWATGGTLLTFLVDQNLQPIAGQYLQWIPQSCATLLGPEFALLRPDFAMVRDQFPPPRSSDKPRILACMGGTDPKDVLSTILAAWTLLPAPRPALDIAVGHNSPNLEKLRQNCAGLDDVQLHVQTAEMAVLMARSRLLVGTAGSISWERCCVGLAAIMGVTANNQRSNLQLLVEKRTGIAVGDWDAASPGALATTMQRVLSRPTLLDRMAARARKLVDGRGAQRVTALMLRKALFLRPAVASDATRAWPWRNAESTRRYFHDPTPLDYDTHIAWWNAVLCDGDRTLLLGMIGAMPVGVLRLDRKDAEAKVSVYLDPALTGLGLGPEMLRAGVGWSQRHLSKLKRLNAEILPQNGASISAFRAAGFTEDDAGQWTHEV